MWVTFKACPDVPNISFLDMPVKGHNGDFVFVNFCREIQSVLCWKNVSLEIFREDEKNYVLCCKKVFVDVLAARIREKTKLDHYSSFHASIVLAECRIITNDSIADVSGHTFRNRHREWMTTKCSVFYPTEEMSFPLAHVLSFSFCCVALEYGPLHLWYNFSSYICDLSQCIACTCIMHSVYNVHYLCTKIYKAN